MNNNLTDLDDLFLKMRGSHAKIYLREAIISYRAGAYRAAVTSTWISICVDIIEKIKELSINGDAEATRIETRLNGIQPNDVRGMLDFENEILEIAHENLGMLSLIEKKHLERIKEDRNICAHPTFSADGSQFVPQPEMARSYIVQACNYLLNQPPVKGKVILQNMYELITSQSFPTDSEKAFIILSSDHYLGRVRDSVHRNLVAILLKRVFIGDEDVSSKLMTQIVSALIAVERINTDEYRGVIRDKLSDLLARSNDDQIKRIIPFLSMKPETWNAISEAIKSRIEQLIANLDIADIIELQLVKPAEKINEIRNFFNAWFENASEQDAYKLVKASHSKLLLDKAIEIFITSSSFRGAESNGLNILLKYSDFLDDGKLQTVFEGVISNRNYGINQITNAGGMSEILAMLYSKTQNDNVMNHRSIWIEFRERLSQQHHIYPDLDGFMRADGIDIAEDENEEE